MKTQSPSVVVDTNVAVAANRKSPQASTECEQACFEAIQSIINGAALPVVDDGFEIFGEYRRNLSLAGQPGLGDFFMKWIHDNQFNPQKCERVSLTAHRERGFEEFPDDPDLADFDPADRKFAAAARVSANNPEVWNALDPGWWDFQVVLARHGVAVKFVCVDQVNDWSNTRPRSGD